MHAEEERFRAARLEEQINDMAELQHHELANVKQELTSMEEKIEYQLEERTRDMQELLGNCQNKVSTSSRSGRETSRSCWATVRTR